MITTLVSELTQITSAAVYPPVSSATTSYPEPTEPPNLLGLIEILPTVELDSVDTVTLHVAVFPFSHVAVIVAVPKETAIILPSNTCTMSVFELVQVSNLLETFCGVKITDNN